MSGLIDTIEAYFRGESVDCDVPAMLERLTMEEVYDIQFAIHDRKRQAGDVTVGYKLAAIGKIAQRKLGIDAAVMGALPASRLHASGQYWPADGGEVLAEAEFALTIGHDLEGSLQSRDEAIAAIVSVRPAIEIIAGSNGLSMPSARIMAAAGKAEGAFFLGRAFSDADAARLLDQPSLAEAHLSVDGVLRATGRHDAETDIVSALMTLSCNLTRHGRRLREGDIVMSGAILLLPIERGAHMVEMDVSGLGQVKVNFHHRKH